MARILALPISLVAALSFAAPASAAVARAAAPAPSQTLMYIPSASDDVIDVVDVRSHRVVNRLKTAPNPVLLERSHDQSKIYVTHFDTETTHLSVLKVADNTLRDLPLGGFPAIIKLSPNGERLWVGQLNNQAEIIDTRTDQIVQKFTYASAPWSIDLSPDGRIVYIAFLDGTAGAYEAATGKVIFPPVSVGEGLTIPAYAGLSADGGKFYTANGGTHNVTVFDTRTWKILATLDMGEGAVPVATYNSPDGKLVYINNYVGRSGNLKVIDVATNRVVRTIQTPGPPASLNFSDDGRQAFVVTAGPNSKDLIGNVIGMHLPPSAFDAPGEFVGFDPVRGSFTRYGTWLSTAPGFAELVTR